MKKLVISLFFVVIVFSSSFAQIQIFEKCAKGFQPSPDINIFGYGQKIDSAGKFKLTYFALIEQSWAEGLVGISYFPTKWCEVNFSVGIETVPTLYRCSGSLWLGTGKYSFSTCVEKGEGSDNYWYKSVAKYQANNNLAFGLMSWRYANTGVFLEYTNVKTGISPWINVGRDLEFDINRIIIGMNIKI